jgi:hypothetical protein
MFSTVDSPALKQLKGNRNWTKAAIESKLGKLFKSTLAMNQQKWTAKLHLTKMIY